MTPTRHLLIAIAAMLGVGVLIGTLEYQRRRPATTPVATTKPARADVLNVVDAARSLKLVTWTFETTISAQSVSDRWYGDAIANVRAPVRYQYGVDLEQLRREDIFFDEGNGYTFIVPAPKRIAVEVDLKKLEQSLDVSGVRWKSQNQSQIERARQRLAEDAQRLDLSPDDAQQLREVSRQQVERLLRRILVGTDFATSPIQVRFAE